MSLNLHCVLENATAHCQNYSYSDAPLLHDIIEDYDTGGMSIY